MELDPAKREFESYDSPDSLGPFQQRRALEIHRNTFSDWKQGNLLKQKIDSVEFNEEEYMKRKENMNMKNEIIENKGKECTISEESFCQFDSITPKLNILEGSGSPIEIAKGKVGINGNNSQEILNSSPDDPKVCDGVQNLNNRCNLNKMSMDYENTELFSELVQTIDRLIRKKTQTQEEINQLRSGNTTSCHYSDEEGGDEEYKNINMNMNNKLQETLQLDDIGIVEGSPEGSEVFEEIPGLYKQIGRHVKRKSRLTLEDKENIIPALTQEEIDVEKKENVLESDTQHPNYSIATASTAENMGDNIYIPNTTTPTTIPTEKYKELENKEYMDEMHIHNDDIGDNNIPDDIHNNTPKDIIPNNIPNNIIPNDIPNKLYREERTTPTPETHTHYRGNSFGDPTNYQNPPKQAPPPDLPPSFGARSLPPLHPSAPPCTQEVGVQVSLQDDEFYDYDAPLYFGSTLKATSSSLVDTLEQKLKLMNQNNAMLLDSLKEKNELLIFYKDENSKIRTEKRSAEDKCEVMKNRLKEIKRKGGADVNTEIMNEKKNNEYIKSMEKEYQIILNKYESMQARFNGVLQMIAENWQSAGKFGIEPIKKAPIQNAFHPSLSQPIAPHTQTHMQHQGNICGGRLDDVYNNNNANQPTNLLNINTSGDITLFTSSHSTHRSPHFHDSIQSFTMESNREGVKASDNNSNSNSNRGLISSKLGDIKINTPEIAKEEKERFKEHQNRATEPKQQSPHGNSPQVVIKRERIINSKTMNSNSEKLIEEGDKNVDIQGESRNIAQKYIKFLKKGEVGKKQRSRQKTPGTEGNLGSSNKSSLQQTRSFYVPPNTQNTNPNNYINSARLTTTNSSTNLLTKSTNKDKRNAKSKVIAATSRSISPVPQCRRIPHLIKMNIKSKVGNNTGEQGIVDREMRQTYTALHTFRKCAEGGGHKYSNRNRINMKAKEM